MTRIPMPFRLAAIALMSSLFLGTSHAVTHLLSGPLDVMQAGTNNGFDGGLGNGTGTLTGDFDTDTNLLNYTITWQNLIAPVTNMHFHIGASRVSGGVEQGVPGPWASPYVGSATITDATKAANLLAGNWYLNIHTDANATPSGFGGGEIRGQVAVAPVPEPEGVALASMALLSLLGLARRQR